MWDLQTIKRLINAATISEGERNRAVTERVLIALTTHVSPTIRSAAKKLLACVV